MGDKAGAKRRMLLPACPARAACRRLGRPGRRRLHAEAERLGYPLLVGRGRRRWAVWLVSAAELPAALAGARRKTAGAFGDDRLMLDG
jgi:acetyl-CoA/propionyl-CoA carboxylase biotin carboxyl carrier protein